MVAMVDEVDEEERGGERVNFQCVIITDGESAYAIYTYAQGAMNFDHVLQREVEVGFGNTNLDTRRVNYYTFDTVIGNTGQVGKWVFKIGEKENIRSKCLSWYQENLAVISMLNFWNSVIPRCPCNEISAFSSGQWIPSLEEDRCYDSFPRFGTFGRRCCYLGIRFGTFQRRIPMAGSLQAATPFGGRAVLALHEQYDTLPKKWCCDQSNLCNLYYIVRPVAACVNDVVNIATSFGDPHFVTLDQKTFTFNGLGEFKILEVVGPDPANTSIPLNFQLQGRTCRAINVTNATVWCVLALSTSSKSTVRVEISSTGKTMVIYANGQDFTQKFRDSANFDEWTRDINLRNVTGSLKVSTADNFGITITLANRLLEFTIDIDSKYKNMTKGLMGNFNGDNTDDLTYPNGTKLPSNSTEREIFSYGYSWVISEATSLFEYPYGTNYSSFLDRYNDPLFMGEVNANDILEAEQKCQSQTNYACIYDFLVTKNEDLAKNSMRSSETFITQSSAIANKAPIINGSTSFNITLGVTLRVDLICSDPDKDNFTVNVTSKLDGFNSTFNIFSGILSITYSPTTITNETFQIVLTDSKGLDSQTYTAGLTVCTNCSKHGDCDYTDLSTVTPYYSVTSCDCWLGYTGDNCELDKDGCSNSPCPAFTNCTDVPADVEVTTGKSYTCSACPAGFKLNANGTKCEDIDECSNATRPCDANAICTNTIGSFQCTCKGGFRKQGSNCVDINECQENIHNCQHVCINEIPYFTCACWEGFKLRTDNITCDKTNKADPCANLNKNCSYGCRNNSGSAECFCKVGFKLSTDGVSCEDIDECKQNLCSQACNNTIGSYACSCYTGYKISDADKRVCEACSNNKYGVNCDGTCECRGRALSCDNVKGCICISGWTGSDCSTDVDECQKPDSCPRDQICRNTNGSFTCSCPSGYNLINGNCTNIDECASFALNDCDQICTDNPGSFSCSCRPGFQRSNKTCLDINECTVTGIHQHKCSDHCVNLHGTYSCSCPIGKVLQNDKRTCQVCDSYHWGLDCINECGCYPIGSISCDPVIGCKCKPGWAGTKCMQDIDECASDVSPCTQLSECKNTPGSFYCLCPTGYEMINGGTNGAGGTCVDIDECVKSNPCDQRCTNVVGSYHCSCYGTGFRTNGSKCFVVNVTQTCSNTTCNQICDIVNDKQVCSCNAGYFLDQDGKTCLDVNECESTNPCVNGQCHNVKGSFYCSCNNGTKLASDLVTCQDCGYGFYGENCSSTCLCNTTNTVLCNATNGHCDCKPGWDSDYCSVDIDECSTVSCPANAKCINSPGSYRCVCHAGYYSNGLSCSRCDSSRYGQDCASTCTCNFANTVECNNTNGYCHCKSGWTEDTCALDIDECQDTSYCLGDYVHCFNLNGSAECNCMDGYEKPNINDTCLDIDECKNPLLNYCGTTGQCINTIGSYKCLCNLGFHEVNGRCTACDSIHYGENCASMCTCVTANMADCNDVNGTCSCISGWGGANCEQLVDQCSNASFCTNTHETCYNIRCDPTHYGQNCSNICQCTPNNFLDCIDVNGTCTCKPGWNGIKCDVDINECANVTYCTNIHEVCQNLNGSAECICDVGFSRPDKSTPCQACDSTHYGKNCSMQCSCNSSNTVDCSDVNGTCTCKPGWIGATCNQACDATHFGPGCLLTCMCMKNNTVDCIDVNGTCTCKPGWNGTNCEADINECAINSNYCSAASETCSNLNGTAECLCKDGFFRPSLGSSCQACDATHFGHNCGHLCTCHINNTLDCNDVNGTCTCNPGWTGINCDVDIDECTTNTTYCLNLVEVCHNLNGSAECLCKVGYNRPTLSTSCLACDSTHYGENCASVCPCMTANTADCNDVNGTCTCNPGWTGTICDKLVDQCSNTSFCTNVLETCYNTTGTPTCDCVIGFTKPTPGASCQACDATHFGHNCGHLCTCHINNTLDCNDVNGTCTCNPGWTGINCDVDIDECTTNTTYCLNLVEVCHNLNGSAECLCKVGYNRPTLSTSCLACDATHFGHNCGHLCTCHINNTLDCNDVNGTCTCNPGWTGINCDVDIDECTTNTTYCLNLVEVCHNLNGSAECLCKVGYNRPTLSTSCLACDSTHYGENCASVCPCMTANTADCNDVNGTCTCNPGWTGTICDKLVDQCSNTSFCTNVLETCYNTTGTPTCDCVIGFTKPTPGASCQACDATHFGHNCGHLCTCHINNTLDCNDVNGTCTCNPGWTGINCDVDIDECTTNTTYCLNLVEVCHNLNGSAECLCKVGYNRPTLSTSCLACDSTHYGENCASVCPCMTANTADCNDVNGTCTCNPGWTGTICDKLVDQCSNTSFCTNVLETCYNTTGTPTCDCVIGFTKPTPGASCQACDATHFGHNCGHLCTCHINNTLDCNDVNGTCTCNPGWTGINCDVDIDECTTNTTYCLNLVEVCHNLNGSAECLCKVGYNRPTLSTSCLACDSTHYGENCASVCPCMTANTADCNDVNGTCTCNPGWTGTICDKLVDQCSNTSFCTNVLETCYNTTGTPTCDCVIGFTKPTPGASCQACDATHFGHNCGQLCTCHINNTLDCNDVNGTCTCNPGWTGINCDKLVDQCSNTSFCTNDHETCYNTTGTPTCDCVIGFTKPTPGAPCQACGPSHFGQNCASSCTCGTDNTEDCNDVTGTCTCKPDWTGAKCDQVKRLQTTIVLDVSQPLPDIFINTTETFRKYRDELINQLYSVSVKVIGQNKFIIKITHFTKGSIEAHTIFEINVTSVSNATANQTSEPVVDSAISFTKLLYEIPQTNFTVDNQTYSVSKIVLNNFTTCDANHFGPNCVSLCTCNSSNTADCNKVSGTCVCKPGWTGNNCDQDCDSTHYGKDCAFLCNCQNSATCSNINGSCICQSGWSGDDCHQSVASDENTGPDGCQVQPNIVFQEAEKTNESDDHYEYLPCYDSVDEFNNLTTVERKENKANQMLLAGVYHNIYDSPASVSAEYKDETDYLPFHTNTSGYISPNEHVKELHTQYSNTEEIHSLAKSHSWPQSEENKIKMKLGLLQQFENMLSPAHDVFTEPKPHTHLPALYSVSVKVIGQNKFIIKITHFTKGSIEAHTIFEINETSVSNATANQTSEPVVDSAISFTKLLYEIPQTNFTVDNQTCSVSKIVLNNFTNCDANHFGPNCVSLCTCNSSKTADCNKVSGTCVCKPGWIGNNCDQDCDSTHYGKDCAFLCNCQNSATCSNINGSCICQSGWSGDDCRQSVASDENTGPDGCQVQLNVVFQEAEKNNESDDHYEYLPCYDSVDEYNNLTTVEPKGNKANQMLLAGVYHNIYDSPASVSAEYKDETDYLPFHTNTFGYISPNEHVKELHTQYSDTEEIHSLAKSHSWPQSEENKIKMKLGLLQQFENMLSPAHDVFTEPKPHTHMPAVRNDDSGYLTPISGLDEQKVKKN
ncbi:hypothetical protein Btru_061290 [Bulinus truncatus]|nr:hypothetical protein Btru_061290 [Bulinus truncatus]